MRMLSTSVEFAAPEPQARAEIQCGPFVPASDSASGLLAPALGSQRCHHVNFRAAPVATPFSVARLDCYWQQLLAFEKPNRAVFGRACHLTKCAHVA